LDIISSLKISPKLTKFGKQSTKNVKKSGYYFLQSYKLNFRIIMKYNLLNFVS